MNCEKEGGGEKKGKNIQKGNRYDTLTMQGRERERERERCQDRLILT